MITKLKKDIKASDNRIVPTIILLIFRSGNAVYYSKLIKPLKITLLIFFKILNKLIVDILFGVYLPFQCKIGEGLRLVHPKGIVINQGVSIGSNCTIYHGVTIGVNELPKDTSAPIIGNNCFFGAGSKAIGNILIRDNVKIGANAVVVKNIPAGSTVVCKATIIK